MAYHNLDSKTDRAIVAYLIGEGAGTVGNCFPALRWMGKPMPNVVVHTTDLDMPPGDSMSGSRAARVEITIARNVVAEGSKDAAGEQAKFEAMVAEFNELTAGVCDALNKHGQSTDLLCDAINEAANAQAIIDPENDSDLEDFGIYGIELGGESQGFNPAAKTWEKTFKLTAYVTARNGV